MGWRECNERLHLKSTDNGTSLACTCHMLESSIGARLIDRSHSRPIPSFLIKLYSILAGVTTGAATGTRRVARRPSRCIARMATRCFSTSCTSASTPVVITSRAWTNKCYCLIYPQPAHSSRRLTFSCLSSITARPLSPARRAVVWLWTTKTTKSSPRRRLASSQWMTCWIWTRTARCGRRQRTKRLPGTTANPSGKSATWIFSDSLSLRKIFSQMWLFFFSGGYGHGGENATYENENPVQICGIFAGEPHKECRLRKSSLQTTHIKLRLRLLRRSPVKMS